MNKHKQFIKECYEGKHGTMCNDWKKIILDNYPEFKKSKYKPNHWYVNDSDEKWIMSVNEKGDSYGLDSSGIWHNGHIEGHSLFLDDGDRLATEEEVKEALIKEAKKRGFKEGTEIIDCDGDIGFFTGSFNYERDVHSSIYGLWMDNELHLFNKEGKWAEAIIPTLTKEEAEKKLNVKII